MAPANLGHDHHLTYRQTTKSPPFVEINPPPSAFTKTTTIRLQKQTNNTLIIVGVLGGLVGTLIFIFLVWKCCYDPAGLLSLESRARWTDRDEEESRVGDDYNSDRLSSEAPSEIRRDVPEKAAIA